MLEQKTLAPKPRRAPVAYPQTPAPFDSKQRGLMVSALCLLLLALAIVLWHDRDFWFPDAPEAGSDEVGSPAVSPAAPADQSPAATNEVAPAARSRHHRAHANKTAPARTATAEAHLVATNDQPAGAIITRTVLPPLEVEVIAGDMHRTIRPGSNSVHVELEPGAPPEPAVDATPTGATETAGNLTSDAAERVQMSVNTSEVVARPVKPSYPLLARQMKVQGSVILQALVGRDGVIQNLRVVSGPPILATAAQEAVRQWHFKPHFEGNFTISTN